MSFRAKKNTRKLRGKDGNPLTWKCGEQVGGFGPKPPTRQVQSKRFFSLDIHLYVLVLNFPLSSVSHRTLQPSAAITCTSEPATPSLPSQLLRHCIQIIARQSRLKPLPSDSSLFSASRSSLCDWSRFVLCPTHPGGGSPKFSRQWEAKRCFEKTMPSTIPCGGAGLHAPGLV